MKGRTKVYTVVKNGRVLLVDTNVTGLCNKLISIDPNAPHYNTLYLNLKSSDSYQFGDYLIQKFSADQSGEVSGAAASPK